MNGTKRHTPSNTARAVALLGVAGGLAAVLLSATGLAAPDMAPQSGAPGGPGVASGGALDGGTPGYIASAARGQVTPPDVEDVEHMCALLTACDKLPFPPQMIPSSMAACVSSMMTELTKPEALKFSLTMRECGLRANSCSELRSCALRGAKPDVCNGRGKTGSVGICDLDGRAISCWHEQVLGVRDCPRGGEQCVVRDGQATCALGACPPENKEGAIPTCSASGTRILQCEKGKLQSLDCAAFGLKCVVENGAAGCAPATPACNGSAKRCEGNVAVGCVHGHEVRVDCAAAGLVCGATPGGKEVGACVSPPSPQANEKCDGRDNGRCDGATVKYCFAGKKRSYFCKALAFDKCVSDGKGARCSN